jgi:hypothetical protein
MKTIIALWFPLHIALTGAGAWLLMAVAEGLG